MRACTMSLASNSMSSQEPRYGMIRAANRSLPHECELRGIGEVGDREDRLEHRLQALVRTAAMRLLDQQELVVGRLLNLDEVRHLCDFLDLSEELADAFSTGESLCHRGLSLRP